MTLAELNIGAVLPEILVSSMAFPRRPEDGRPRPLGEVPLVEAGNSSGVEDAGAAVVLVEDSVVDVMEVVVVVVVDNLKDVFIGVIKLIISLLFCHFLDSGRLLLVAG